MEVLKCQHYLGGVKACVWFTASGEKPACRCLRANKILHLQSSEGCNSHLNLPIRLKCENISPPGTYSITM